MGIYLYDISDLYTWGVLTPFFLNNVNISILRIIDFGPNIIPIIELINFALSIFNGKYDFKSFLV